MDGAAGGVGAVEDRVGGIDQIMFAQRFSDIDPARGEEGVGHAAADNQVIDPPDQVGQHVDLARHLGAARSEEHTSELQSLMRISYDVFCLKKKREQSNKVSDQTLTMMLL